MTSPGDSEKESSFLDFEALNDVKKAIQGVPCLRTSLLAGMTSGTMMGVHRWRMGKPGRRAFDWGFLTCMFCSAVYFTTCSAEQRQKKRMLRDAMRHQGFKEMGSPEDTREDRRL